jgi:GAF domain-containing protein
MNRNDNFSTQSSLNIKRPVSAAFNYKAWREGFLLITLRISCLLGLGLIIISFTTPTTTATDKVLFIGLFVILLAVTFLRTSYTIRAFTFLFVVYTVGLNSILAWGPWLDGSIFFIAFITLSALLFDQRVDIFALAVSILTFAFIGTLEQSGLYHFKDPNVPITKIIDWVTYTVDLAIASGVVLIAINLFKQEFAQALSEIQQSLTGVSSERNLLENRVRERTEELETQTFQLRTSSDITRTIAEIQDISELIETVTNLITEKFNYYHSGLYILDENNRTAFLQASSSLAGKQLIGQGFRIEPDRRNPFNLVIEQNRALISSDAEGFNFYRDTNFPLTRSRMILPLAVRGRAVGILDLHSDQPQAFNLQDAEILQTLADLVAISFDNVRLINETQNLLSQLNINSSIETRNTWSKLTSRNKPTYQYTPAGVRPVFSTKKQEVGEGLSVPLNLNGQTIGSIKLKRKGEIAKWSDREHALVVKIAEQVALALENSRLVDEAQKNALRDQMITNISSRVRETLDVESVIRTATTELRRVFDLKEAEISVGSPQVEAISINKHTGPLRLK